MMTKLVTSPSKGASTVELSRPVSTGTTRPGSSQSSKTTCGSSQVVQVARRDLGPDIRSGIGTQPKGRGVIGPARRRPQGEAGVMIWSTA
jgi:hypothetical protein